MTLAWFRRDLNAVEPYVTSPDRRPIYWICEETGLGSASNDFRCDFVLRINLRAPDGAELLHAYITTLLNELKASVNNPAALCC